MQQNANPQVHKPARQRCRRRRHFCHRCHLMALVRLSSHPPTRPFPDDMGRFSQLRFAPEPPLHPPTRRGVEPKERSTYIKATQGAGGYNRGVLISPRRRGDVSHPPSFFIWISKRTCVSHSHSLAKNGVDYESQPTRRQMSRLPTFKTQSCKQRGRPTRWQRRCARARPPRVRSQRHLLRQLPLARLNDAGRRCLRSHSNTPVSASGSAE